MNSKVTFDIDELNNPVINADISITNDVRDKIADRFRESFDHVSNLSIVKFNSEDIKNHKLIITPLGDLSSLSKEEITPILHNINSYQMLSLLDIFCDQLKLRGMKFNTKKLHNGFNFKDSVEK